MIKEKIQYETLIYNPLFNEYEIFHTNQYYIRISNMINKWRLTIKESAYLIINFEISQTLSNTRKSIKKNRIIKNNINFIKRIMIKEQSIYDYLNIPRLNQTLNRS